MQHLPSSNLESCTWLKIPHQFSTDCLAKYLSNVVDPEKSVSDEQGLHSPKLMRSLNMPWTVKGPGRVPSHHVIECLQSLRLFCSLRVLQSGKLLP